MRKAAAAGFGLRIYYTTRYTGSFQTGWYCRHEKGITLYKSPDMTKVKLNFFQYCACKAAIFLICLYQILVSPFTGGRAVCRFTPTCSEYTKQAIKRHGLGKGIRLGAIRISRCRPGGGFGYDPVP